MRVRRQSMPPDKEACRSGCSGGKAAGYIGELSGGKVIISAIKRNKDVLTTVRVKYINVISLTRYDVSSLSGEPKTDSHS